MPCSVLKRGRGDGSKVELAGGSRAAGGPGCRSSSRSSSLEVRSSPLRSMRGALSLPMEDERRIRPSMRASLLCAAASQAASGLMAKHARAVVTPVDRVFRRVRAA
eukprot:scaffold6000_cov51-Phaeocystis_antarctica.AAC.2